MSDLGSNELLETSRGFSAPTEASLTLPSAVPRQSLRSRLASAMLGGHLLIVAPVTAAVSWHPVPCSEMSVRFCIPTREARPRVRSLRELAETALGRMTSQRRSLYEDILRIRLEFGEPVDVNSVVREIREDVG